ncbi:MAG: hypothetical protein IH806_04685 [Proteobacteria bacterium]|nr:hypothetical protein [Pseudomonadota bacterium]
MVEHQLTNTSRRIDRIVDAIADGTASGALKATLADLEAEKEQLEDERQGLNATSDVADLHPNLPELYRRRVAELEVTLRRCPAERAAAGQILRPPIEGIVVHPGERHGETRIEVAGSIGPMDKDMQSHNIRQGNFTKILLIVNKLFIIIKKQII